MGVVGVELSTATKGMPYGGRPKSGCSLVDPACMVFIHFALFGLTGSVEMSVFQMLFAGNTSQAVPGTGAAPAAAGTRANASISAAASTTRFTGEVSA